MRIAAVVLAAGESRRLGTPKQLLSYRGQPLLRAIAREACGSRCDDVAVVVRENDTAIAACLEGLPVTVVANPGWAEGIASSIRRGVEWATRQGAGAVLLLVCDQPALNAAHIDRLVSRYGAGARVVASRYADSLGVPALFGRELFGALLSVRGSTGAKRVIRDEKYAVAVDWPEGVLDVDTPADAARMAELTEAADA
jgi:molybdenum cofactor cytidylyltransferase